MRSDVAAIQLFIDSMVGVPQFSYPSIDTLGTGERPERPTGDFCFIKLIEEYSESIPAQYVKDCDADTTTYLTRSLARLRFRIGLVDESGTAGPKIMHNWTNQAMLTLMNSTGFGFIKVTPISNESAKLEHVEWETRQGFSLDVYVERNYEEVVNNIRTLGVTGKFITPSLDELLMSFSVNNY